MPQAEKSVCCCCFSKNIKNEDQSPAPLVDHVEPVMTANVPFSADLPKDLTTGKAICVTGVVLPKCSRFSVNLTCGRSPSADVAFHFNPRIIQRYVVRNTRINGHWGAEEKTSTLKFPFKRNGKKFVLTILIGDGEFLVEVDGVHFCTYEFRVPWEKVTGIGVEGFVDVLSVEYKQLEKYPEVLEDIPEARIVEGSKESMEFCLRTGMVMSFLETDSFYFGNKKPDYIIKDTPVTFLLLGGFQRDYQLEIYGRVKILPHSFYVNLQVGAHRWPHPNIPLHLNPRFGMGSGEPSFVRNAWIDNGWGQEERSPGFQFEPGSPFTMAIRRGNDHFSVWVDGKLAGEFKFRSAVDDIDTVHIEGDVVIFDVFLNAKPEKLGPTASCRLIK